MEEQGWLNWEETKRKLNGLKAQTLQHPISALKKEGLSYIAGVFDSEVSLMINKTGAKSSLQICYVKTNREILDYLSHYFGGNIYLVKKQKYHRFQPWQWKVSSGRAYLALKTLYPFLRIKKEAAQICMNYYEHIKELKDEPIFAKRECSAKYASRLKEYHKKHL